MKRRQETFGPSNDEPIEVQVEIRAVRMLGRGFRDWTDNEFRGFQSHPGLDIGRADHEHETGWLVKELNMVGVLLRYIPGDYDHDAWSWDPTRPVAGQYEESLLSQVTPHDPTGSPVDAAAAFVCGEGVPDAFLDAQEYETQRASEPDIRDEDDWSGEKQANLEDALDDAILDRVDGAP